MSVLHSFLATCRFTKTDARIRAIARIKRESLLERIVANDPDRQVKAQAERRLQELLADVAKNGRFRNSWEQAQAHNYHSKMQAVGDARLRDEDLLSDVAFHASDRHVRRDAARRITNQATLATLATTDESAEVRNAATALLTSSDVLLKIAKTDPDRDVQTAAIENAHLNEQSFLAQVVKTYPVASARDAAFRKLTDPQLQQNVACYRDPAAVEPLDDQDLLAHISTQAAHYGVRLQAVKKLNSPDILAAIVKNVMEESDLLIAAIENPMLRDQAALLPVVMGRLHETWLKRRFLNRITEQSLLAQIAISAEDPAIQQSAAERIVETGLLGELLNSSDSDRVCTAALVTLDRTGDATVLRPVLKQVTDGPADCRQLAVDVLTRILGRNGASFATDDLRMLADVESYSFVETSSQPVLLDNSQGQMEPTSYSYAVEGHVTVSREIAVDCGALRQAADAELARRGRW